MDVCEEKYASLVNGGCTEDIACDRVFDTLQIVLEKSDMHCFDPRDRMFENKLRTVVARKGAA